MRGFLFTFNELFDVRFIVEKILEGIVCLNVSFLKAKSESSSHIMDNLNDDSIKSFTCCKYR